MKSYLMSLLIQSTYIDPISTGFLLDWRFRRPYDNAGQKNAGDPSAAKGMGAMEIFGSWMR